MTQNYHLQNGEIILEANGMSLETSIFCGQSFSWQRTENKTFLGVVGEKAVFAKQQGDKIYVSAADKTSLRDEDAKFWLNYFALEQDYSQIQKAFSGNEMLKKCVDYAPGIRVLNQPFFDTLLGFIVSQRNNIPKIMGITSRLRGQFGKEIAKGICAYPTAEKLAGMQAEELAPIGAGYRAKYIIDAAQRVLSGEINEAELKAMPTDKALEQLLKIHGVGDKVANCVLLFSLGKYDAAPVDVWIKRMLVEHFPDGWPKEAEGYKGIAQQYMFYWGRQNKVGKDNGKDK